MCSKTLLCRFSSSHPEQKFLNPREVSFRHMPRYRYRAAHFLLGWIGARPGAPGKTISRNLFELFKVGADPTHGRCHPQVSGKIHS